eukprot:m.793314 g.793314  ORF g.793314 m.793314 type:complete len:94 (+) comp59228_c0_seq4:2919-3200(+)
MESLLLGPSGSGLIECVSKPLGDSLVWSRFVSITSREAGALMPGSCRVPRMASAIALLVNSKSSEDSPTASLLLVPLLLPFALAFGESVRFPR